MGILTNNYTLIGPKGSNRTVNETIVVEPNTDVSIVKTADKEEYHIGENVIWTITVSNTGNGTNATNVTVKDILPSQVEFVTATGGTYNNETGIWYIGFMENGTSQTLVITSIARVNETNITNIAEVSCNETEWDYTNNIDNATIKIVDIPINKTSNVDSVYYGGTIDFYLSVTNEANVTWDDIVIMTDELPEGIEFVRVVSWENLEIISNDTSTQNITFNVTNIPALSTGTIVVRVKCLIVGDVENPLNVTVGNFSTRVNKPFNVNPIVDVSINKTADKEEYHIGKNVIWTITVTNAGNGTNATNVTVKDILPSQIEFVTATGGNYNNETGIWYIGFMENGTSQTLVITSIARVNETNITNIAEVSCNETEWNYTNNIDNATIKIVNIPINKTSNVDSVYYGGSVDFYLSVTNLVNETWDDIIIMTDELPEGLEFVEVVSWENLEIISNDTSTQNITFNVTNIPALSTTTIVIRVNCWIVGDKENPLNVTVGNFSKEVYKNITVNPIVDVSVDKIADDVEYKVNETVTWTITVSNANNGTEATNVLLKDILPKEVEFVSYTATKGTYNNETGIWDIGTMANGTSETLTIISTAKTPKYNLTNTAIVNCTEDEWDYTNNEDNATVNIIPTIIKTPDEEIVYYHDEVEYNLTVINFGDGVYTDNLTIIDTLDESLEYLGIISITGADQIGETIVDGQKITLVITNIPAFTNATVPLKVRVNGIGFVNNTMDLKTPQGSSENVTVPIKVEPIVDVATNKTRDKEEYFVDDIAIWTINVSNAANGTNATNVVLKDVFPSEFVFIDYTATKGTYNYNTGEWNIGFMENGTYETLVIRSYAKIATNLTINKVNVTCNEDDWNLSNNVANKTVSVIDLPDPEKTVNDTTPFYGETVEYNLTVTNIGNITYTNNLRVIDSLPNGLEFIKTIGITGAKLIKEVVNGQVITWTITDIAAYSNAVITVKARAKALGDLTNNMTILGPNGTNKTVNCTITPKPLADLAVIKTNDHYRIDCLNSTTVTWTIKVVNNGPNDAINAIVKDILPKGIIYISDDSNGKYNPKTGVWKIGNLANGKSKVINIKTKCY